MDGTRWTVRASMLERFASSSPTMTPGQRLRSPWLRKGRSQHISKDRARQSEDLEELVKARLLRGDRSHQTQPLHQLRLQARWSTEDCKECELVHENWALHAIVKNLRRSSPADELCLMHRLSVLHQDQITAHLCASNRHKILTHRPARVHRTRTWSSKTTTSTCRTQRQSHMR